MVNPGLPESPRAVAAAPEGGFYIADQERHQILYLSPEGKLQIWAGTGQPGSQDGPAAEAQFQRPVGLALDRDGSLLVVDQGNHQIRRINRSGQVSTVAGAPLLDLWRENDSAPVFAPLQIWLSPLMAACWSPIVAITASAIFNPRET
ncbi:MAG: hypothetical protein HC921_14350 [Synechococcaceae cyanobacterium SM2_3_1]|nr:hypothetical protein [Synechococcaceae cyanobacterium SM2_3_1]